MRGRVLALHVWPSTADTPQPLDEITVDWGGAVGDRHHGETMSSDSRQSAVFDRGTTIRNHRQLSLVDAAELAVIASALGVPDLAPGLIADNICTGGIPDLTSLPRMTRLVFEGGVVLMTGGENMPCTIAGAMVQAVHGTPPQAFPKAAIGHRGLTAWVERPGVLRTGEAVRVLTP